MSYGAKIVNSSSQVIMDASSPVPLLVARVDMPYLTYTWGNPFEPSPAPVPIAGCSPSTHFAIIQNGNFIPIVQNGQIDWIKSGKTGMYDPDYDVMLVFKYQ